MLKNPTAIAILNFFFIGLGTLLHGKRPSYGLLLFVGGSFLRYEELRIAPAFAGSLSIHWVLAFIGMVLLGLGTAIDGYREAQQR